MERIKQLAQLYHDAVMTESDDVLECWYELEAELIREAERINLPAERWAQWLSDLQTEYGIYIYA